MSAALAPELEFLVGPSDKPFWQAAKLTTMASFAEFCRGAAIPASPLEVFLELSNICDLKCAMCWQFSALNTNRAEQLRSQDRGFLDKASIDSRVEAALTGALLVHCFGFGEPTLHPAFREIVDSVSAQGAMIDFYTNGMHLDADLCAFLVDRHVSQIVVSASGATKDIYENIYIGGDFAKVLSGIRNLAAAKRARNAKYPIIHVNSVGFRAVREGIMQSAYPSFCQSCLGNVSMPSYAAGQLVEMYLNWHEAAFGPGLRAEFAQLAPGAEAVIRHSCPETILFAHHGVGVGETSHPAE